MSYPLFVIGDLADLVTGTAVTPSDKARAARAFFTQRAGRESFWVEHVGMVRHVLELLDLFAVDTAALLDEVTKVANDRVRVHLLALAN